MRIKSSWRLVALLAAALAGVAAAGCGDDSEGTTGSTIAKAAFLRKADAVCEQVYERVRTKYLDFVKGREDDAFDDPESVETYADTVLIPEKQRQVEELRALGAPSGEEEQVEAIVEAYEEGIETAEEDPQAAVTSTFGVFVEATALAEKYGLENCRY